MINKEKKLKYRGQLISNKLKKGKVSNHSAEQCTSLLNNSLGSRICS